MKDNTGHETRAAMVHWMHKDEQNTVRLPNPDSRPRVCPTGQKLHIQGRHIPEQEATEMEDTERAPKRKEKKRK